MTFIGIIVVAMVLMYNATGVPWSMSSGGLITGWFLSAALGKSLINMPSPIRVPSNPSLVKYDKSCRIVCGGIAAIWAGALIVVLFTAKWKD